jgi:hypothetical protein
MHSRHAAAMELLVSPRGYPKRRAVAGLPGYVDNNIFKAATCVPRYFHAVSEGALQVLFNRGSCWVSNSLMFQPAAAIRQQQKRRCLGTSTTARLITTIAVSYALITVAARANPALLPRMHRYLLPHKWLQLHELGRVIQISVRRSASLCTACQSVSSHSHAHAALPAAPSAFSSRPT